MSKITRKKRKDNFTLINNDIFKRKDLSWKAKGLLCHLISLPDDWQIYVSQLSDVSKDGKESTANGIKELIKAGYILRRIERDEKGKFKGYDYLVSDEPEYTTEDVKTVEGEPENGKPENGEPATTKDLYNKELKVQKTNKKESLFLEWKELFGALRSRKGVPEKRFKALNLSKIDELFIKTKQYLAFLEVAKWRPKKSAEAFLNQEFWNQDWDQQKKEEGKDQQPKQAKTQNYFNGRG